MLYASYSPYAILKETFGVFVRYVRTLVSWGVLFIGPSCLFVKHRVKDKIYRVIFCVSSLIESLGQAYVKPGFKCRETVATSYTRNQIGTEVAATDRHMKKTIVFVSFRYMGSVPCQFQRGVLYRYNVIVFSTPINQCDNEKSSPMAQEALTTCIHVLPPPACCLCHVFVFPAAPFL